jgi:hypothetical protein
VAVVDKCLEEDLAVFRATVQDIVDELEVRVPPQSIVGTPFLISNFAVKGHGAGHRDELDVCDRTHHAIADQLLLLLLTCCCRSAVLLVRVCKAGRRGCCDKYL